MPKPCKVTYAIYRNGVLFDDHADSGYWSDSAKPFALAKSLIEDYPGDRFTVCSRQYNPKHKRVDVRPVAYLIFQLATEVAS